MTHILTVDIPFLLFFFMLIHMFHIYSHFIMLLVSFTIIHYIFLLAIYIIGTENYVYFDIMQINVINVLTSNIFTRSLLNQCCTLRSAHLSSCINFTVNVLNYFLNRLLGCISFTVVPILGWCACPSLSLIFIVFLFLNLYFTSPIFLDHS